MRRRSETSTNAKTHMYKHEHMRLVARQDHGFVRTARKTQRVTIKQDYRYGDPQSLSQRSTGKEESNRDPQLDCNAMREARGVKRVATITAGVLRPRCPRTYARPAPVNRAKEARPRLDRGQRFDRSGVEEE